jgi:hypothetical protein
MRQGSPGANIYPSAIAADGTHVVVGGMFSGTANLGGNDMVANGLDAIVASYDVSDGSHVWSQQFGEAGQDEVTSMAASSARLTVAIAFSNTLIVGSHVFTAAPQHLDYAIVRLNPATGAPGASATQLENVGTSNVANRIALTYGANRLAGAGTFSDSVKILGATLTSVGRQDIVMFQVDF